jgi:hypothetical protein
MTQNTNLNVSPYFDDFNEDKNYNKVLFKPGFPIQSRELTTLQSILQGQIEKFGQHFFKEGSMVVPGGIFYDAKYFAVRIDPTFIDTPVSAYISYLKENNIEIQGEISGVKATVVDCITNIQSEDKYDTLYIKYNSSGLDGETREFRDGENLITLSDIVYSSTTIPANNQFARCIVSESTKIGSSSSVSEGIYFARGYFIKVPASTVILDQYTNTPSYKVGLQVTEEILTASLDNPDLFDNAQGFSNESAPGADRFSIKATLTKKLLGDNDDSNFIELLRVNNGVIEKVVNKTDYSIFKDELARRTYDESGDYYIRPFSVDIRESLNDRIGNNGVYLSSQLTQTGNTPSDDIYTLQISSGKAYVRGYEIEKQSTSSIDVEKPRTTRTKENISVPIAIGNNVQVENVYGSPTIGFTNTYTVDLKDQRLNAAGLTQGNVIGNARVYDFGKKSISGIGTERFDLKLFDIQTFTTLTIGLGVTANNAAFVRGKFSGAGGHLKDPIANGTTLSLRDVEGQFQINEPLEINGLDVGRNITVIRDNDISDVKSIGRSVGVSTFAANVALSKEKNFFPAGATFNIQTNGNVTSPSVSDMRQYFNVNDIVKFSKPGGTLPTFNRVSVVNQNAITLVAVQNIVGVCDGTVVTGTAINVTDFNILTGIIENGDEPGKIVSLPNNYISSINLLDSNYIVRKQVSKNITTTTFTFQLSDLGDNDLFLEPYTENNYTLTWEDGHKEIILDSQVTISGDLKSIEIKSLTKTGNATLTITCKRSKLTSKSKTITRCANLVVDRSKFSGAGIGSTTFNDGLTENNVYGTRVQDEAISLNVPDVTRVLAIFESNDDNDPDLPSIIVSTQSDTFTNNVIIGEQFIGSLSGAVARVVDIVSGTQINFVYENDKKFELTEEITLRTSGIVGTISTLLLGDRNISSNYILDTGHREEFCDIARITRKSEISEPTRRLRVIYDYFVNDESTGTVESVNSYNNFNYSTDIPTVIGKRASDFIDLRPRVDSYDMNSTDSPFAFESRSFASSRSETAVTNKTVVLDYAHYLGRIDRLYLTKEGEFQVKQGEPAEYPKAPVSNNEAFEVGNISMNPYVFDATFDTNLKLVSHKRFTMRDIGGLENRVKNLENYTTLSLLETDTKNLSIKDPNTGLDKFKSGFFVDNFRNHSGSNLTGDSFFDIDMSRGECRPRSTERNVPLQFETKSTLENPVDADYRWAEDFADANITRGNSGLTLNYEEVTFIDQPLATRTENLNPFLIVVYAGTLELNPATDFWVEEVVLPTPDIVRVDSIFNGMAELLGVEDRENGGMAPSFWNSSEQTWTGRSVLRDELISQQEVGRTVVGDRTFGFGRGGVGRTITSNVDIEQQRLQTVLQTGTERTFGLELTAGEDNISLGDRVIGIDVIHNCRARNIQITGSRLKPNTRYYVFMENVDMNEFVTPKKLSISMIRGAFKTGDIIDSVGLTQVGTPGIRFRAAQHNHEVGPFNAPSKTVSTLSSSYSGTSNILNVDLSELAGQTSPDQLGYVREGMILVNSSGTAECRVLSTELMSDSKGDLQFSLHIPDPSIAVNPKFTTGTNTIRLSSSITNSNILDPGESSAETEYQATGYAQSVEEQVLSIRTPQVERRLIGTESVSRVEQNVQTTTVQTTQTQTSIIRPSAPPPPPAPRIWADPLAQSFLVDTDGRSDGIYVTGGDLFFRTKDPTVPVTVQIRTMRDGTPTTTIVPFGQVNIEPEDVNLSDNGSVATNFKFDTPVYLQSGYEYALTLVAASQKYLTFITRMGEEDLELRAVYNKQPYLGSLFKSQNQSTWTPSQLEDLKFKLNKAKFVTNVPSSVTFYNSELPVGKIKKNNPVTAYSKRQFVGIAATTNSFGLGNEIRQGDNNGKIFATGGPLKTDALALVQPTAGVGLTDGSFTGIGFTSLTGFGSSCVATVQVASGAVNTITVTAGGAGYQVGDLLLANPIGSTGSGVRVTVGVSTLTNLLIVDNVKNNISAGAAYTYFNDSGTAKDMPAVEYVNNDPIRDGVTMLFDHHNHGMHSSTNKLKVDNVESDVKPTTLSAEINDDTTVIKVASGADFTTFEGTTVGAANTGYLKIDKEIISYNTISGNDITIANRVVDASLKSNHANNTNVFKYEFNEVSLLKINKEHNIDPREKTFNSYYVSLLDTTKSFNTTKVGGGELVEVSQNIPFEYVNPSFNMVNPSGTSISARIKTTSGTSLSGTEASFQDLGYENITMNKLNRLDSPRIVASKVNESGVLGGEKSFALELLMSTTDENVSPMVDLDTTNLILVSNIIDSKVSNYETDSRVNITGFDPNSAIYETKRINLEFSSNSLFVQFDAHRMAEAGIKVFYKLFRNDGNDSSQTYIPFNVNGDPDKIVNPNKTENAFSEYKFTAENTPQFNGFMIKVVMTSTNQAQAPRIKNFRSVALRSFSTDE